MTTLPHHRFREDLQVHLAGASADLGRARRRRGGPSRDQTAALGSGEARRPVLGLDIGGTKIAAGVVTPGGQVLGYVREVTPSGREPGEVLAALFTIARQALDQSGMDVAAVGISCGGPLDRQTGVVSSPPNLPSWHGVAVTALTTEALGLPAVLENDATCGALAEYTHGAGSALRDGTLLYLTISTGVGGGFIADGRLLWGAAGNGGEPGHITVVHDGRPCACGRRGCLEAYCSGTVIAARTRDRLREGRPSSLDPETVTAEQVSLAAQVGDQVAGEVWRETTDLLGQGLTSLVNVLEPDVAVIGGGVARSGAALFEPVARIVAQAAMPPAARAVQVRPAVLGEGVCVMGAGLVALDHLAGVNP